MAVVSGTVMAVKTLAKMLMKKMSKKALDEWAEERGIILDRRKTKAHMIAELNKQL